MALAACGFLSGVRRYHACSKRVQSTFSADFCINKMSLILAPVIRQAHLGLPNSQRDGRGSWLSFTRLGESAQVDGRLGLGTAQARQSPRRSTVTAGGPVEHQTSEETIHHDLPILGCVYYPVNKSMFRHTNVRYCATRASSECLNELVAYLLAFSGI